MLQRDKKVQCLVLIGLILYGKNPMFHRGNSFFRSAAQAEVILESSNLETMLMTPKRFGVS